MVEILIRIIIEPLQESSRNIRERCKRKKYMEFVMFKSFCFKETKGNAK
ncbi:MAG: hypothetical protein LBU37_03570 [Tannerellaceae bacterium]|jgi:hypothetical protein|nr:hypothetical protein [Tannerellaceae bacterium]